jgi:hypothetical protein
VKTYNPSRDYCYTIVLIFQAGNFRNGETFVETFSVHVKILAPQGKLGDRTDVLKRPDLIGFQIHKSCDLCVQALHKGTKLRANPPKPKLIFLLELTKTVLSCYSLLLITLPSSATTHN